MLIVRLSKISMVAAMAFFATLVTFGNITDYGSNFAFVRHVLLMDTIFPDSTIKYRAIESTQFHHAAYTFIIAIEGLTAVLCWAGAWRLWHARHSAASAFNTAKSCAVVGLTLGFLMWQVGFVSIGGEWFGMWMSDIWNGTQSAFRFFVTLLGVLIYLTMNDGEIVRDS
ncbi:MAG: DUF2165 domain-containing protein [Hyphomicrobiales bacterium]